MHVKIWHKYRVHTSSDKSDVSPAVSFPHSFILLLPSSISCAGVSLSGLPYPTQIHLHPRSVKKEVMFSDDKNWFPISSTMTASFPATQAIWPTLLRQPGAVDQGDSCLHLRPHSLRSERRWERPRERGRDYSVFSLMHYRTITGNERASFLYQIQDHALARCDVLLWLLYI